MRTRRMLLAAMALLSLGLCLARGCDRPGGRPRLSVHEAVEAGDASRVKALLAGKPELLRSRNADGGTPLHLAAEQGRLAIARLLLDSGADTGERTLDRYEWTPLHLAAMRGRLDVVRLLLDRGADARVRNRSMDWTPLHAAALGGNRGIVELLIARGGDPNCRDRAYHTPADKALEYGHLDAADLLLQKGSRLNFAWWLHYGVRNERRDTVQFLLDRGADVSARDPDGFTPLQRAARLRPPDEDMVNLLLSHGATVDVHSAAALGRLARLGELLRANPSLAAERCPWEATPLYWAAESGRRGAVELLLASGARPDAGARGGFTPLHAAAANGHRDAVRALLAGGASVEAKTEPFGDTPLHCAAAGGHGEVAELLLAHRAVVNAKNHRGERPLHKAADAGDGATVGVLLAHGAGVNAEDASGLTALDWATRSGHRHIADLLRKHGGMHSSSVVPDD